MSALVNYCCVTNTPKPILKHRQLLFHRFWGSGIQVWLSWTSDSRFFMRLQLRCQPGLGSHLKAQLGKNHFQACSSGSQDSGPLKLLEWELQFLTGVGQRASLSFLPQLTSPELASLPASKLESQKGPPQKENQAFYNLISEVSAFHFCHILFIRNRSLNPDQTQREIFTQRHGHQEAGTKKGSSKRLPTTVPIM